MHTIHTIKKQIKCGKESFTIALEPDQALNPNTWRPPITWTGYINDHEVVIIQKDSFTNISSDFEFAIFPENLSLIKHDIIILIKRAVKSMD